MSYGYGGIGVSNYYRPTTSYYSYRGALPYGYGSSYYPHYNSNQPYLSPYSSGYVPAIDPVLTPSESSATTQLFDGQVDGQPIAVQPITVIDAEVYQVTTNEAARSFQQQAEQAFKQGDYAGALDQSQQALSMDPDNGKLMLFVSQANYALGNFSTAAELVLKATDALPSDQWGFVAGNFRTFYGRNDYVRQTDRLSRLIVNEPENAQAQALRGYHYGALGYPEAASRDFQQALKLDPDNALAKRLLPVMGTKDSTAIPGEIQVPTPAEIMPLTPPQS